MFSQEETLKILLHLEIELQNLPHLKQVLETAIAQFESEGDRALYHQQAIQLVAELEQIRETATNANNDDAGLIRADVLEWSESKPKDIQKYKDDLRRRLARLIGWECPLCSVQNCF